MASWYPLGRVVGQTLYPGLMVTAYFAHSALNFIGIPLDIRDVCVFTAPVFAAFCAWSTYGLTYEATASPRAALISALLIGVSPAYISRSTAGAFDNEAIAIFTLVFSFYSFLRAMRIGSLRSIFLANLGYFYMVTAWGGYVFVINVSLDFYQRFSGCRDLHTRASVYGSVPDPVFQSLLYLLHHRDSVVPQNPVCGSSSYHFV